MSDFIAIRHGALCKTYEKQVNEQGFTYGDKAEFIQKIGEWVYGEFDIPHCSICGHDVMPNMVSPYCPNCGAKMEGVK